MCIRDRYHSPQSEAYGTRTSPPGHRNLSAVPSRPRPSSPTTSAASKTPGGRDGNAYDPKILASYCQYPKKSLQLCLSHSFGNKSPKPSSKTVTNDNEGVVRGENVRALGEVARLDLTLDDLLVAGVYHRNAQCSSTKRLYFLQ